MRTALVRVVSLAVCWLLGLGIVLIGVPTFGSPLEEGRAAYQAGDYGQALRLWAPLVERGDPAALFSTGVMYERGLGVERDDLMAVRLYRRAAEKGFAPAQFNLGAAYEAGRGVARDLEAAARWWRAAAEQGFVRAQYNLGTLYYYGWGVARDLTRAVEWFEQAAAQGDADAERVLTGLRSQDHGAAKAATAPTGALKGAEWIRRQPQDRYTIQMFANWTRESVMRFAEENGLGAECAYLVARRDGSPWHILVCGSYTGAAQASRVLAQLPARLRVMGPWVRSMGDVRGLPAGPPPTPARRGVAARPGPVAPAPRGPASSPSRFQPETWILARPGTHYTLQVLADASVVSLKRVLAAHPLAGDLAVFESRRDGRPWYSLIAGSYPDLGSAKAALDRLPAAYRKWSPWIRDFGGIQSAIRRRGAQAVAVSQPPRAQAAEPPPRAGGGKGAGQSARERLYRGQQAFNAGDYGRAYRLWRPLADRGRAEAQYNLGFLYESGWGVERDYATAIKWYRAAAIQGNVKAGYNLGRIYLDGLGVKRDVDRGLYWVLEAAAGGHRPARELMAEAYAKGLYGLPQDSGIARYWAGQAAAGR